jgi:amino acid adenylation domain-containing protein
MPKLLQDWVTTQAQNRPEAIAVVAEKEALTYSELELRSNRLARLLKEAGCQQGDRIALLMPKSAAALVGLLGIYKADCIYVPLDPSSPPERLAKILLACGSKLILAGTRTAGLLDGALGEQMATGAISIGWMEEVDAPDGCRVKTAFMVDDANGYAGASLDYANHAEDPAHILFTSGSTGTPKGVVITHGNVIQFIEWATRYFGIVSSDRNSAHPPLPFDLSFLDIFGTFSAGAQLHLVLSELNVAPNKLAEFIRNRKLTQWFSVPSVLHYMAKFDVVEMNDFPELKRVLWCGEVFPTASLIYWMKKLPHVQFTNLYGPTETTIASSYYTVPQCPSDPTEPIPIGAACAGEELLVLDDKLKSLPPGEVGDLWIRGTGLSRGYWHDPDATNRVFIPNPYSSDATDRIYKTGDLAKFGEDGLVYFVGRKDTQIKSRGYRIELGEIEVALSTIEGILESAVVTIAGNEMETALICCAYVPAPGIELPPVTVRKLLSKSLPSYMLPVRWRVPKLLPKNSSGKIDRRVLKEEFNHYEEANPIEAILSSGSGTLPLARLLPATVLRSET